MIKRRTATVAARRQGVARTTLSKKQFAFIPCSGILHWGLRTRRANSPSKTSTDTHRHQHSRNEAAPLPCSTSMRCHFSIPQSVRPHRFSELTLLLSCIAISSLPFTQSKTEQLDIPDLTHAWKERGR